MFELSKNAALTAAMLRVQTVAVDSGSRNGSLPVHPGTNWRRCLRLGLSHLL